MRLLKEVKHELKLKQGIQEKIGLSQNEGEIRRRAKENKQIGKVKKLNKWVLHEMTASQKKPSF